MRFVDGDAEMWRQPADRVLCVGASHAWGGAEKALFALARLSTPGGRLLFADGYWERPPSDAAVGLFGDGVRPLAELAELAGDTGWRVLHLSSADLREWDEFESTWLSGRQEWLLANPADPQAAAVQTELDTHLAEYLGTYRGVLGFCYLVLAR